ncbi:hypothetical protein [Microbacterium sp.]|uniref:hypothetical protein n=1 Tax=Microbacterium sp. TaxID=51671 RepID=UPI003A956375
MADSNLASIVGAIAPAAGVVLFAMLRTYISAKERRIAYILSAIYLLDLLLTGSRGILLIVIILVLGVGLSLRTLWYLVPLLLVGSGALFMIRFAALTGSSDALAILINSSQLGYARFVPASPFSVSVLQGEFGQAFFFPVLQINQYASHAIFEFSEVFRNAPNFSFALGSLIPQVPFFERQTGFEFTENLYYTFPGTLALAFGAIGAPIAAFVLGSWLGRVVAYATLVGGSVKTVVAVAIFGLPFVNTLGGFDFIFFLVPIWIAARYIPTQVSQVSKRARSERASKAKSMVGSRK